MKPDEYVKHFVSAEKLEHLFIRLLRTLGKKYYLRCLDGDKTCPNDALQIFGTTGTFSVLYRMRDSLAFTYSKGKNYRCILWMIASN